jgi:hypothetical protein
VTDADRDATEADLRRIAGVTDPVPGSVVAAARAAFLLRRLDAELSEIAELTYDSWSDQRELVGVRGPGGARQLTFEGATLAVELEVATGRQHELIGQIVPPQPAEIIITDQRGSTILEADELGRFSAVVPLAGPVRIRCRPEDGAPTDTEWLVL